MLLAPLLSLLSGTTGVVFCGKRALVIVALALFAAQQTLAEWATDRAPYGFDITPDMSIWINIAKVGRRDDYAILADDMRRQAGQKWPEFWVRGYHAKNPDVNYRESKTRYRIDCERRTITTVMQVMYDSRGSVLREWVAPSSGLYGYTPIVPGSLGARFYGFVCPT